jgi:hypothetical protein
MARKSKKQLTNEFQVATPKYYAYYNHQDGTLISVSSEISTVYEHGIEISFDAFERLLTGKERFSDYKVDVIVIDDEKTLGLIPLYNTSLDFKNNLFVWIHSQPSNDTDVVVKWNKKTNHWEFNVTNEGCRQRLLNGTTPSTISFYVLLESDFDFLIRTISFPPSQLLMGVYVPFESKFEHDITKISIATKTIFDKYGLEVIDE